MHTHENNCKTCFYPDQDQMGRREFVSKTATCTAGLTFLTFSGLIDTAFAVQNGNGSETSAGKIAGNKKFKDDTKKIFLKKGACSTTFFYLLNLEFEQLREDQEYASSALAGGILEKGHQCGMLWGTSMAAGAEAYRRFSNPNQAITATIITTQDILQAFIKKNKSPNCLEITEIDFSKPFSLFKMMFNAGDCFRMAEKWRPKAIKVVKKGLSGASNSTLPESISCAGEIAKKMGATEEESMMVAGFAGGYGLSGNACGALAAAVWMKALAWKRQNPKKKYYPGKKADGLFKAFMKETGSKLLCHKICGRNFNTIEEHTEFIKNGGCQKIMNVLENYNHKNEES